VLESKSVTAPASSSQPLKAPFLPVVEHRLFHAIVVRSCGSDAFCQFAPIEPAFAQIIADCNALAGAGQASEVFWTWLAREARRSFCLSSGSFAAFAARDRGSLRIYCVEGRRRIRMREPESKSEIPVNWRSFHGS
jgi:hypothetical protein